jgi:hypothetical protein
VFVNAVGGVRISEPAADLAVLLAIQSSLRGRPLPRGFIAFGEVGLAGEVRPAPRGQERLKEAAKLGFSVAVVPKANAPKKPIEGLRSTRSSASRKPWTGRGLVRLLFRRQRQFGDCRVRKRCRQDHRLPLQYFNGVGHPAENHRRLWHRRRVRRVRRRQQGADDLGPWSRQCAGRP